MLSVKKEAVSGKSAKEVVVLQAAAVGPCGCRSREEEGGIVENADTASSLAVNKARNREVITRQMGFGVLRFIIVVVVVVVITRLQIRK